MSKQKLFIPEKINVGYREREGTYTGKLAYIIYWDEKGKLRKEASWQSWRDTDIPNDELENVPTEGFVLNKGVGGQRESYGWNARNEYIRVFDPRGFEFEISVANLLFILQESNSIVGKGLEGEFVYSWEGKELVLIPVSCQEYKDSKGYTELQSMKVTKAEMVPGCAYQTKKGQNLVYLGRFDFFTISDEFYSEEGSTIDAEKVHVFFNEDFDYDEENTYKRGNDGTEYKRVYNKADRINDEFIGLKGFTKLAVRKTEEPVANYAELMDKFNSSTFASRPTGFEFEMGSIEVEPTTVGLKHEGKYFPERKSWDVVVKVGDHDVEVNTIKEAWQYEKPNAYGYGEDRGGIVFKGYEVYKGCTMGFKNDKPYFKSGDYYYNYRDRLYSFDEISALNVVKPNLLLENGGKVTLSKINY